MSVGIREAIAAGYESVKPGWTRLGFAYFITQVRGASRDMRDSLQIWKAKRRLMRRLTGKVGSQVGAHRRRNDRSPEKSGFIELLK
jgi:hypothetical protein